MVYLYTFVIGICTAADFSILTQISKSSRISLGDLNLGTGLMQLMQGWCNLIWQHIAMAYGRRLVYVSTVPLSHGAGQWFAHRMILGMLCSSVEVLPELSVQDLFFAHERGHYIALYAFVLFGSNFIAPLLAGFIADGAGWQWVVYFATIILAVCSVITFFFLEETIYFRNATDGLEVWQYLTIPIFFPNILWAGLLYGSNLALYSVINGTISDIIGSSPYNFRPTIIGVAYLSPFIFGDAVSFWADKLADSLAIKLAKRHGGVREPEQRLWILSVSAVMASGGLLRWGVGASQEVHYMVLIIGIGITKFGVLCASAVSLAYATDCFGAMAGESFVSIMIIRNTIGFAFSYAITPWTHAMGLRDCFISVSFFCTYTSLVVIFRGESWRRSSAKRYWEFVSVQNEATLATS
ncbi:major facilitator superfamily domain-containing protein [Aspergillus heterothallicus]